MRSDLPLSISLIWLIENLTGNNASVSYCFGESKVVLDSNISDSLHCICFFTGIYHHGLRRDLIIAEQVWLWLNSDILVLVSPELPTYDFKNSSIWQIPEWAIAEMKGSLPPANTKHAWTCDLVPGARYRSAYEPGAATLHWHHIFFSYETSAVSLAPWSNRTCRGHSQWQMGTSEMVCLNLVQWFVVRVDVCERHCSSQHIQLEMVFLQINKLHIWSGLSAQLATFSPLSTSWS